jgi:hypothetical protein
VLRTLEPQPIIADQNLVQSYFIGSDQVILLGATALVSSKSVPGQWREVDAVLSLCACPGFLARGHCRHVSAVREAQERDRETAQPVPAVLCSVCGKRPPCSVLGRMTTKCARCTLFPVVE